MNAEEKTWRAGHEREHALWSAAEVKALAAERTERELLAAAHNREHELQATALSKAERASDIRFEGVNQFREQLREQATTFASQEVLEHLRAEIDRRFHEANALTQERFETNRASIVSLEKGDSKQEGKQLGQAAVVGLIVGAVGFVGTILGILMVALRVTSPA